MKLEFLPKKYLEYLGLGAEIAASLAAPIILGYYIDQKLGTVPIGILGGVILGMTLFFVIILRIVKRMDSDAND